VKFELQKYAWPSSKLTNDFLAALALTEKK